MQEGWMRATQQRWPVICGKYELSFEASEPEAYGQFGIVNTWFGHCIRMNQVR
jgi:hypothetical protein